MAADEGLVKKRWLESRRQNRGDVACWSASHSKLRDHGTSPVSSGQLSKILDDLSLISFPIRSISCSDAASMVVLLCDSVPPSNEVMAAQLCQFIYNLSVKQQVGPGLLHILALISALRSGCLLSNYNLFSTSCWPSCALHLPGLSRTL